jgi:catenin alpha
LIISPRSKYAESWSLDRRQLRKAVVDHVSDSFLEPDTPLLMLISAAREGREKEVRGNGA